MAAGAFSIELADGRLLEGWDAGEPGAPGLLFHFGTPSAGIPHVIVNGMFVVRDGELVAGAMPGRAVRVTAK